MIELTSEQRLAVEASGPICLTASAGSGKTRVLVERYLHLLRKGAKPEHILAVTFTRKAGRQLIDRLLEQLADKEPKLRESVQYSPWIGTLHAFCLQVLRQWGFLLGREGLYEVLNPLEQAERIAQVREEWKAQLTDDQWQRLFEFWAPADLDAMAHEVLARPHGFLAAASRHPTQGATALAAEVFTQLVSLWRQRLKETNRCTFDDLEHDTLALLRDVASVRDHYQRLFSAVLVDEFQDTSPVQWEILQHLLGEKEQKLFVVGDPKQSIYRFREADVHLFQTWNETLQTRGGNSLQLDTCFRSSPDLIDRINAFSEVFFAGSTLAHRPIIAGRRNTTVSPLSVARYSGDDAREASDAERRLATQTVLQLLQGGTPASEIALLFRNGDRLSAFAQNLADAGVAVTCEPVSTLFAQYEARDLTAYLHALVKPSDDAVLAAFLRTPYVGMSPEDLQALNQKPGQTLYEKLLDNGRLGWFTQLIQSGKAQTQIALECLFASSPHWPQRSPVLWQVLGGLAEAVEIEQALKRLKAWEEEGVQIQTALEAHESGGVRLMTVHGSKGLEFEEVLLVDGLRRSPTRVSWFAWHGNSGLGIRSRQAGEIVASPAYAELAEKRAFEEEQEARRVLYVAVTRAKERLHVFIPENEKLIPKGSWAETLLFGISKGKPEPPLSAASSQRSTATDVHSTP